MSHQMVATRAVQGVAVDCLLGMFAKHSLPLSDSHDRWNDRKKDYDIAKIGKWLIWVTPCFLSPRFHLLLVPLSGKRQTPYHRAPQQPGVRVFAVKL